MKLNEFQQSIEAAEDEQEVREEIERTVEENDVVVFMKGNRMMPQCGYSARAAKAISLYTEDFVDVDVLRDERIRQVLEEYSDWPTIPQVFVGGELVGGSDIVVEMHEEGELEERISAAVA